MLKTTSNLVIAALIATLPTIAAADGTAVALSASLDDGSVTSVAVAAAFGEFAVASSVANAKGTGAASGASDDAATTPSVGVTYNSDAGAYETNVTFTTNQADEVDEIVLISCDQIFAAADAFENEDSSVGNALVAEFGLDVVLVAAQNCGVDVNLGSGLSQP